MASFFYYLFAIFCCSTLGHTGCGTDKIKKHKIHKNINVKPIEKRRLQETNTSIYKNIRIHYSTTQLENDWSEYRHLSYWINDVIPAANDWIQKVVSVRPVDGPLILDTHCHHHIDNGANKGKCTQIDRDCHNTIIPYSMFETHEICNYTSCKTFHETGMYNTDLIIYVTAVETSECVGNMAYAAFCHINSNDRPIAGHLNLCKSTIATHGTPVWEAAVATIVHETFHVLGFYTRGFPMFKYNNGTRRNDVTRIINKRGSDRVIITLPTVVSLAKEFFNCSYMDGIELDGNGGALSVGSHWNGRILLNDIMVSAIPSSGNGISYTIFTLAVLADSGWYSINWDYSQLPANGRNKGCEWYDNKCIDGDRRTSIDITSFCTSNVDYSCGASYVGLEYCTVEQWSYALPKNMQYWSTDPTIGGTDKFADFCPVYKPYNNVDCRGLGNHKIHNIGESMPIAERYGGFISGKSKCALISGSITPLSSGCYPTECFINYLGIYVGTRLTMYKDYLLNDFHVLTCWAGIDDNIEKPFIFKSNLNDGFDKIYCPVFNNICYDQNSWICSGHGTIKDGKCICSPGYFGKDCTIENNAKNRVLYTVNDSLSVYMNKVCNGTIWNRCQRNMRTCIDENIGMLSVEINGIYHEKYNEKYFRIAIQNWIAILMDISQCNINIRNFVYNNSIAIATMEIYYYSTDKTYNDISSNKVQTIFHNLFGNEMNINVIQSHMSGLQITLLIG
eukprot:280609_1